MEDTVESFRTESQGIVVTQNALGRIPGETLTSRERVRLSLSHKEPDRVPLDLGSTGNTGITAGAYRRLIEKLGIEKEFVIWDRMQQLALPDEDVLVRLGIDTRGMWPNGADSTPDRDLPKSDYADAYIDEWQVVRSRPLDGLYYDLVKSPLPGEISEHDIRSFPWPDADDPGRVRGLVEKARRIHEETDYALVLHIANGFITRSQYLRGFEDWFMDLIAEPERLSLVMDRCLEFQMGLAKAVLSQIGQYVDVLMLGDDIGVQGGPMVSPAIYRKLLKPRQAKMFELAHSLTPAPILYHTCGSVVDLLDDLIEIGVDILNPVQVAAKNMDSASLKARFGDRVSFWGGIDTQGVMPTGSVEEVRAEARKRISDLGPGGGYVVDTVHNIQADVPPENILALYDEARRFGVYPLDSGR